MQNKRLFLWSSWKEREREREGGVVGEGRKEGRKEGRREGGGGSCVFCGVCGFWSEEEKKNLVRS